MPIAGLSRGGTAPARKQRLISRCIGAECASRPPCDPFMAHRLKDQAFKGKAKSTQRPLHSVLFPWLRGSEESAQPGPIGHKSACSLGHWRFVTCFDVKTPGGRGISVILGVYIKALCRHLQRPVRAEGVPLHDAEGFPHNGVYVKGSRHGRRKAATGYRP
jgi:hypothetical protein